ncbi:MAG: M48 family metalloprotease [Sulfurimonas sp.]|jgi:hypothetical protein|uniref:M48 family metalloprotease n=1 Tax=Sulfurimonas sp. TaxID=2022749 RepID=UPI0026039BCD|nr:M48 family metalloprotease [Sulfurimonas sp.]MDD3475725.1 M48 family metalloprotease [Sulfurimonas sp.]
MKKIILSMGLTCILVNAFDFVSGITSIASQGMLALGMDGKSSSIEVDSECKEPFESYDYNLEGIFQVSTTYGISKSGKILNFINDDKSANKVISDDFREYTKVIARNFLWIPLEVEKLFGETIYQDRINSGDVVLRTTKNLKYKKMYTKLDDFLIKYNNYIGKSNQKYPYDIKINILSTQKKAESVPYGYIFISEDYIANGKFETILVHELAHISKRHSTKDIQYRLVTTYDNVTEITELIKNLQDASKAEKFVQGLSSTMVIKKSFELYTQDQEIEADACGLRSINLFIPNKKEIHVKNFIENINNVEASKEVNAVFEDHPDKSKRIENINRVSAAL